MSHASTIPRFLEPSDLRHLPIGRTSQDTDEERSSVEIEGDSSVDAKSVLPADVRSSVEINIEDNEDQEELYGRDYQERDDDND